MAKIRRTLRKKSLKRRSWKALNVLALASLVFHMSAVGVFLTPASSAQADVDPNDPLATPGAIWTTRESCEQPQNENHYIAGDHVYIRGDNFAAGEYAWDITGQPGGASGDPSVTVASDIISPNSDGYFCFDAYTVHGDDWGEYKATVGNKHDNYHVDGTPSDSIISGTKINDLNQNGAYNAGEPGLANWHIVLWDGDTMLDEAWTDASGNYSLPLQGGLPAGAYSVCETMQLDWATQNALCQPVQVNGTDAVSHVNFFNYQIPDPTYSLQGYKWNDLNGNGIWNGCDAFTDGICESGLSGWTINLYENLPTAATLGTPTATDVTDENGQYSFGGLPAGNYTLCEEQQAGWTQTWPVANGGCYTNIILGDTVGGQSYNFGNHLEPQTGSIHGSKWFDQDGDGGWDKGEPGLQNWTIYIAGDQKYAPAITDVNGDYWFNDLPAGDYTICEQLQEGWTQTFPGAQSNWCHEVAVETGETTHGVNFGNNTIKHFIHGSKWNDANGNASYDAGEEMLGDWTIQLWQGENLLASTQTSNVPGDTLGWFSFDNLQIGSYVVCEVQQENWTRTKPMTEDGCYHVTLTNNIPHRVFFAHFANQFNEPKGIIHGYKWNDLNGNGIRDCDAFSAILGCEPLLGGWTIQLWQGDSLLATTQTNTDDMYGWYAFEGLFAGDYRVCEVQQAGWTQTSPVKDGCYNIHLDGADDTFEEGFFGNHGSPDLQITKKIWDLHLDREEGDEASLIPENEQFFLKIGYKNLGTATATDVLICDPLASYWVTPPMLINNGGQLALNAGDGPCGTPNTLWWNVGDVAPGAWGNVSAILDESSDPGDYPLISQRYCKLDNIATISVEGEGWADVNTENNTVWATHDHSCPPIPSFSIKAWKDDGLTTVAPGGSITYTINWQLTSFEEVPNVVMTDLLPDNVSFVSASANDGAVMFYDGVNTVTWNFGDLQPTGPDYTVGGWQAVTVTVESPLDQGTEIFNQGTFCTLGDPKLGGEGDEELCNGFNDSTTVISDFTLALEKTDNVDPVFAGDPITYTLDWSISGNATAYNAVLKDTLPPQMTFVSASNGGTHNDVNPGGDVMWTLGDLAPGASGSFTLVATVNAGVPADTSLFNIATLSAEKHVVGEGGEEVLAAGFIGALAAADVQIVSVSASADETTLVALAVPGNPTVTAPILTIDKTVSSANAKQGDQLTYTIVVRNTGDGSAINPVLNDVLPAGLTFSDVGGTTRTWNLGATLSAGNAVTISYPATVSTTLANGSYENTANVKADNHSAVQDKVNVVVTTPVVLGATTPSLTIKKTTGSSVVNAGDTVTYTVEIQNTGDGEATNVVLKDLLPDGLEMTSDGSAMREWAIGTMKAGQSGTFIYTANVSDAVKAGDYTNTAQVAADGLDPIEANATVQVADVQVLGAEVLAETGAGIADYLTFVTGALLLFVGALGFRKSSALA